MASNSDSSSDNEPVQMSDDEEGGEEASVGSVQPYLFEPAIRQAPEQAEGGVELLAEVDEDWRLTDLSW